MLICSVYAWMHAMLRVRMAPVVVQVTAHSVAEEGGVMATWQLDRRGMCMAYQSEQVTPLVNRQAST